MAKKIEQERDLNAIFAACPMDISQTEIEDTAREGHGGYLFVKTNARPHTELDDSGMYYTGYPAGAWVHCSRCGGTEYLDGKQKNYPHGDSCCCPFCDAPVKVHNLRYSHKTKRIFAQYAVMKVLNFNEVYIRCFYADFDFSYYDVTEPIFTLKEVSRYYFTPGFSCRWKWNVWKGNGFGGDYDRHVNECLRANITSVKTYGEPFYVSTMGYGSYYDPYGYNFNELKNCFLRYSALDTYKNIGGGDVGYKDGGSYYQSGVKQIKYLQHFAAEPVLEKLLKIGYTNLVFQYVENDVRNKISMNFRADTLRGFFRNKLTMPEIQQLTECTCVQIAEYIKMRDRLLAENPQKSEQKIKDIAAEYAALNNRDQSYFEKIDQRLDLLSVLRYLSKTNNLKNADLYNDYIKECIYLEYDLTDASIIFPKSLAKMHSRTAQLVQQLKDKQKYALLKAGMQSRYAYLKNFEFTYGPEFIIRVPQEAEEIIIEGKKLEHCVGGYAESHAKGDTNILFLRKCADYDTPFYTIEMNNNGTIAQCRGFKNNCANNPKPPEVKAFEKAFCAFAMTKVKELKKAKEKAKIKAEAKKAAKAPYQLVQIGA